MGARVEMIEAGEPRPLAGDEVLLEVRAAVLEVRAAVVGNWDEFVRTGGWNVGAKPPMALGVEAAGRVLAVGQAAGRNRLHDLAPPNRGRLSSTHIPGADAPVEEPSTASEADNAIRQSRVSMTSSAESALARLTTYLPITLWQL
jgi:NADPH:quinone reductase-like Zn-dependent oxidoreductase